jgi:hypothetical protein
VCANVLSSEGIKRRKRRRPDFQVDFFQKKGKELLLVWLAFKRLLALDQRFRRGEKVDPSAGHLQHASEWQQEEDGTWAILQKRVIERQEWIERGKT